MTSPLTMPDITQVTQCTTETRQKLQGHLLMKDLSGALCKMHSQDDDYRRQSWVWSIFGTSYLVTIWMHDSQKSQKLPQCKDCGLAYRNIIGVCCGSCKKLCKSQFFRDWRRWIPRLRSRESLKVCCLQVLRQFLQLLRGQLWQYTCG